MHRSRLLGGPGRNGGAAFGLCSLVRRAARHPVAPGRHVGVRSQRRSIIAAIARTAAPIRDFQCATSTTRAASIAVSKAPQRRMHRPRVVWR